MYDGLEAVLLYIINLCTNAELVYVCVRVCVCICVCVHVCVCVCACVRVCGGYEYIFSEILFLCLEFKSCRQCSGNMPALTLG